MIGTDCKQIPLLRRRKNAQSSKYEVCREGITFLRTIGHKKLRIVFNVTHTKRSLLRFSTTFLKIGQSHIEQQEDCCLSVLSTKKQLSDNRILLILSAYLLDSQSSVLLLAQITASLIIYHEIHPHFSTSPLVSTLADLGKLLKATNLNQLNEELKFRRGYAKSPYFLCLNPASSSSNFLDYFRYGEGMDEIKNQAVDTLINFFPERSEIQLDQSRTQIQSLGEEFIKNIVGRMLFNFEFTGSAFENLLFQFTQFSNQNVINVVEIFHKVIQNQKSRVMEETCEFYFTQVSQTYFGGKKIDFLNEAAHIFPINTQQLSQTHKEIQQKVIKKTLQMCVNCMDLAEFKAFWQLLQSKMEIQLRQISNYNQELIQKHCRECYSLLQNEQSSSIISINELNTQQLFRKGKNELQLFLNECRAIFQPSTFVPFKYFYKLFQTIFSHTQNNLAALIDQLKICLREKTLESQNFKYQIQQKEAQLNKLINEYSLQSHIVSSSKIIFSLAESEEKWAFKEDQIYRKQFSDLRKKNCELQEQLKELRIEIDDLNDIIQRWEGLKQKEKMKLKFSKEINDLIKEVSLRVNSMYSHIEHNKKMESSYDEIKRLLAEQKQNMFKELKKVSQNLKSKMIQNQQLSNSNKFYQSIVSQAKQSIKVYKQVSQQDKQSISQLQKTYTQVNCLLAETESQLQLYKKALTLLCDQAYKAKSENLIKFWKVLQPGELKQMLKVLIKK